MSRMSRWCRYGSVLTLLTGGALSRGEDPPPLEVLRDWIVESYRAVAPKTLASRT